MRLYCGLVALMFPVQLLDVRPFFTLCAALGKLGVSGTANDVYLWVAAVVTFVASQIVLNLSRVYWDILAVIDLNTVRNPASSVMKSLATPTAATPSGRQKRYRDDVDSRAQ